MVRPIPQVPTRAPKLVCRRNMSIMPPSTAVPWYPALATQARLNLPIGIIVLASPCFVFIKGTS
jgi:hypothetical protein